MYQVVVDENVDRDCAAQYARKRLDLLSLKRIAHTSTPALGGILIAAGVGAAVFGLTSQILLKPRLQLRLASQTLSKLEPRSSVSSQVRLDGRRFHMTCSPVGKRNSLISVGDNPRVLITSTRVRLIGRAKLSFSALSAIADLAGCPRVLSSLLARRVQIAFNRDEVVTMRRDGRNLWIRLTRRPPWVVVEVNRSTLEPIGVRFRGRFLNGTASIREVGTGEAPVAVSVPARG